jgi:TonB family protein
MLKLMKPLLLLGPIIVSLIMGQSAQWQPFSPPEGAFEVQFPGKPQERRSKVQIGKHLLEVTEYYFNRMQLKFFDMPPPITADLDPKQVFDALSGAAIGELKGVELARKSFSLDNNPGQLIDIKAKQSVTKLKLVLVDRRIYWHSLTVDETSYPALVDGSDPNLRFLESFRLIPRTDPDEGPYPNREPGDVDALIAKEKVYTSADIKTLGADRLVGTRPTGLKRPHLPMGILAMKLEGTVRVRVVVDENGKVIAAQIVRGHPQLREPSLKAARESTYMPARLDGKPVKFIETVTFNFRTGF